MVSIQKRPKEKYSKYCRKNNSVRAFLKKESPFFRGTDMLKYYVVTLIIIYPIAVLIMYYRKRKTPDKPGEDDRKMDEDI